MSGMKRTLAFATILLLGSMAAAAQTRSAPPPSSHFANRLLDDVVQMTRAGLSDATIIAYLKSRSSRFVGDVNASDLIQMQHAGVSEVVLHYIASVTGVAGPPLENSVNYDTQAYGDQPPPDSGSGETVAVGPSDDNGYGGYPYWYGYAPYWYGYASYPYWYAWGPYWGWGWGGHGGHSHGWGHAGWGWHGGGHGGGGHAGFHSQGARMSGGHGGGSHGGGGHGGGGHH